MKLSPSYKEFLEHAGKVLIVENDQPAYVISKFQDYMELVRGTGFRPVEPKIDNFSHKQAEKPIQKENPYLKNSVATPEEQQIAEINRELEAIAEESFFMPIAHETVPEPVNSQFYRELE